MDDVTETPNNNIPEREHTTLLNQVHEVIDPLQKSGIVPESAVNPMGFATYAEFATGVTNLSVEHVQRLRQASMYERRELPVQDITCPIETTIVTTNEPSHQEALQAYGFSITSRDTQDQHDWAITFPPTHSFHMQALMLYSLQRLGILPEVDDATGNQAVFPSYVRVLPLENLAPEAVGSLNPDIPNGITTLHNTMKLAYGLANRFAGQQQMLSTETLLTDETLVLGVFGILPGEEDNNSDMIRSNQILGTALLEWIKWKTTDQQSSSFLRQSVAESFEASLSLMQHTQAVSIQEAKALIHEAVKNIEDFLYPEDEEEV